MGVFKSVLCGVWRESLKLHRHDLRVVTSGIRALVFDTPLVRSACRMTFPTDESSVKTILLKMCWIVLIRLLLFLTSILFLLLPLRVLSLPSYLILP